MSNENEQFLSGENFQLPDKKSLNIARWFRDKVINYTKDYADALRVKDGDVNRARSARVATASTLGVLAGVAYYAVTRDWLAAGMIESASFFTFQLSKGFRGNENNGQVEFVWEEDAGEDITLDPLDGSSYLFLN